MREPEATTVLARWGWGAQGKSLGISRMFQDADIALLKSIKAVAAVRPRGILSGFLVVHSPQHRRCTAVFVPPVTAKQQPFSIRLRLAESLQKETTIFSAYVENGDVILEDVLVWQGKPLFATVGFAERWRTMGDFVAGWQPDDALQGCSVRLAEYLTLQQVTELAALEERQVLEIVPLAANSKRYVWVPSNDEANAAGAAQKATVWIAKRETLIGPDIFSLWSPATGEKQPALALVRTLAVSKVLRQHPVDEFKVNTAWNKMFERWEILDIA